MKSKKIATTLLTVSLISSMALVGCGGNNGSGSSGAQNENGEGKLDSNQYINLILQSEPKTIDQSKSSDSYSSQILTNCQEGLTRIIQDENGQGKIEAGLAEKWEMSEDGLKWTFHLRDAKWSDGEAVTADQFVYAITRTLSPETASKYSFLLSPILNADEYNGGSATAEDVGVKAIDDKTLEFTLKAPCAYFLDLTYFKVMQPQRKDIVEKHGDMYGTEANTMAFVGPFTITEWVHNSKVEFAKNENYWDADNVKLEKATMKIIKESNAAMQELYSGSLDMGGVNKPEWIEKLDATGQFNVLKGYDASTTYTFFNQSEKVDGEINIFSNEKVRKAFIIAEKREEKIATLRKGLGEPALSFCPPSVQIGGEDYRTKVDYLPVQDLINENSDPKALLVEGLKELGLEGDPSKVTINYLQSGTDTTAKEFAEFQQQAYEEVLGVNVEIEYVEWAVFTTRTDRKEYQVAGMGWTGDYNDPNTYLDMWTSTAGIVPTGWSNEAYDELIAKAGASTDENERAELFKQAEKILVYEDGVISPETWRVKNTYVRNYVKNYSNPLFGTIDLKYTYTSGR